MSDKDAGVVRKTMHQFTQCVLRRSGSKLALYLMTYPGSATAEDAVRRLAVGRCLVGDGSLKFEEDIFRGEVYNSLYQAEFANSAPLDISNVGLIDYRPPADLAAAGNLRAQALLREVADCVVRRTPHESHVLLTTPVASPAEGLAFNRLRDDLGPCLTEGAEVSFSRSVLRGVIAEVFYRLSRKAVEEPTRSEQVG